jgi:hypothetical protein
MHNPEREIGENFDEAVAPVASDAAIIGECRSIAQEICGSRHGLKNVFQPARSADGRRVG